MKFLTYSAGAGPARPGVETAQGDVLDVRGVLGPESPLTVAQLMGAGQAAFDRLHTALAKVNDDPSEAVAAGQLTSADAIHRHAPLGERVLAVCAGANYHSHLKEMGGEPDNNLAWFVQNPNSIIGIGEPIRLPPHFEDMIDFEGELCVVFGRRCHDVTESEAMDYVGGYTVFNDISARQGIAGLDAAQTPIEGRYAWTDMLLGKQFPTFGPMGPVVVTADEILDPGKLHLTTTLNDTLMQDANTSDLVIGIASLIEKFSRFFTFEPGDVISTGTPGGVGAARNPAVYLRPGDVVTVTVDGVGALSNPVVAADTVPVGGRA